MIRLTQIELGFKDGAWVYECEKSFYVRKNSILAMIPFTHGDLLSTEIWLGTNRYLMVKEKPETILEMIK